MDFFKPSMLPVGCAHLCLSGIHLIAKKLGIDCAPAVIGWTFHGAGWAVPQVNGYIVCKEHVPASVDAWRALRMDAAKAAAEERSNRAVDNWRKLVPGLFLWHYIKAQFALAALHDDYNSVSTNTYPVILRHLRDLLDEFVLSPSQETIYERFKIRRLSFAELHFETQQFLTLLAVVLEPEFIVDRLSIHLFSVYSGPSERNVNWFNVLSLISSLAVSVKGGVLAVKSR
ncbi:hypothetical protein P879_08884 [Paragonimus westermani]|uniref:Rad4 beta-hairpin domain-containing protein n=1 Tax=Paragonimus westermani TaxID=34504 RepID=A0A8T0DIP5_9TREM|nr:hypothetical protein P879_08884 [Paragonimus westermani]